MKNLFFSSLAILIFTSSFLSAQTILFQENWESGVPGNWNASHGIWQVGIPSGWPTEANGGMYCLGTEISGNYPSSADSRMISVPISLPANLSAGEEIKLIFWHSVNIWAGDSADLQISIEQGPWITVTPTFEWNSDWTKHMVDLTEHAGKNIRIAFHFESNSSQEARGWYIDDVSIELGHFPFINSESFEFGLNNWYAEKGLWQAGFPTGSPGTVHSGQMCAGTHIEGNYTSMAETRLISPSFLLKSLPGQQLKLFFWHWLNIWPGDPAQVQISINHGQWQTISTTFTLNSGWTQHIIDLSAYEGNEVRLAFYFASNASQEARGWYIDDVEIKGWDSTVVSIERDLLFSNLQLYPNPSTGTFLMEAEWDHPVSSEVEILDLTGRVLKTWRNEPSNSIQHSMDLSNQSAGTYFIRISIGGKTSIRKIILTPNP